MSRDCTRVRIRDCNWVCTKIRTRDCNRVCNQARDWPPLMSFLLIAQAYGYDAGFSAKKH